MTQDALAPCAKGALRLACDGLLSVQTRDGWFPGDLDQGVVTAAQLLIVERFLGVLQAGEAAATLRWMRERVGADGSVEAYPAASYPSFQDTCVVLGAVVAAGAPSSDPLLRSMRAWVESRGGLAATDTITRAFLVMARVLPASELPAARIEHVLVDALGAHLARSLNPYFGLVLPLALPGLIFGLRSGPAPLSRVTRRARGRLIDHLLMLQNPEGNWLGSLWCTALCVACLHALGVPPSHDAAVRGRQSLGRFKRRGRSGGEEVSWSVPIDGAVWNTAMALRVMTRAGVEGEWSARAVHFLLRNQGNQLIPDGWTQARPGAPRTGGWSFEVHNQNLPDTDTTAMVLMALADHRELPGVEQAIERGRQWLVGMQSDSGGFGAYSRGARAIFFDSFSRQGLAAPQGLLGALRLLLSPPAELSDFPSADLTGRVLSALGRLGVGLRDPLVERAHRFLLGQRQRDLWLGRWTTNYIAAGAFVGLGLLAVGEPPASEPIARVIDWMLEHQNEDGGFGERNESYQNPALAGVGPSNAYLTGLVLQLLCAAGQGRTEAASRAASYLCASQRPGGLWDEFQAVQLIAVELFYKNFVNFQTAPIEGLAAFCEVSEGGMPRPLGGQP